MEKIGRYQLLEEIGRGAMGVVYRAQDPAIGRVIAIKTIRLSDLTDESERERLRERLFREAQLAGVLSHPNIVTIYDIAEEGELAFIFMELVSGPSLERKLSEGVPGNDAIIGILRQTASALDYAHKKGIIHRDIKPANILIHEDGQAKITDFGVAKIVSQQITQSGAMMGTPNYMSPEQVQGHTVDGRSDQFALGVIAYEILTGEKPFAGDYLPTLIYKIVRDEAVAAQRLNPTLGPQVDAALRKALAKAPDERYLTCTQFVHELASALAQSPGWHALRRGASQSMPTIAAGASNARGVRQDDESGNMAAAESGPGKRTAARDQGERNPLLRSLVWVLLGIGLIGLAVLGAQKLLFNNGEDRPTEAAETKTVETPAPRPSQTAAPPKAAPVHEPAHHEKPSPIATVPHRDTAPLPHRDTAPLPHRDTAPPVVREPRRSTAENPAPSATQQPGGEQTVSFVTDPPGATVALDGNGNACKSPCMLKAPQGRHVVKVTLDGYRAYPRILNVPPDSDVFIKLSKASGSLSITSNPPGATIAINGQQQTQTTPAVFHLTPGTYHLRVVKNGVPLEFDAEVHDSELLTKSVNFQ